MRFIPLLCLTAILLFAGETRAESLGFAGAQRVALKNNPELAALHFTVEEARGQLIQAGRWPNPELDFSFSSDAPTNREGQYRLNTGIAQKIPWGGRLDAASNVSRVDVALAYVEIRDRERLLLSEVQRTFIQSVTAAEKIAVQKTLLGNAELLEKLNRERVSSGQASVVDLNLARLQVRKLKQEISLLEAERESALAELRRLMGLSPTAPLQLTQSLSEIVAILRRSTSGRRLYRADLVRASLEADRTNAEIRLAKAEAWEDLAVGLEYERERSVNGEKGLTTDNLLGFKVSIPLPIWNRNQGTIKEKRAAVERLSRQLLASKAKIEGEIAAERVRAGIAARASKEIQAETLPLMDETQKILQEGIRTGQADTTQLIQATNQEAELRAGYIEAIRTEAEALARLETALGSNPHLNRDIFKRPSHPAYGEFKSTKR